MEQENGQVVTEIIHDIPGLPTGRKTSAFRSSPEAK
jgi:hypothetical protein